MANSTTAVPFNTDDQNITFLAGSVDPYPVTTTMAEINLWYYYTVRLTLTLGVEVGVLLLMLLITLILSKPEKRKGKIFKLNIATMITGFLRVLFLALYNDSRGQAFYVWFSYDHSGLTPGNYAVSMLAEIFEVIMVMLIEASLWVQARTVTQSYQLNWKKTVVFVFSAFFAFLAIGFRIAYSVFDSIGVLYKGQYIYNKGQWIQQTSVTLTSASIIWFCGIFGSKMWITYKDRKNFVSYQFKPMDYFIVGACCTMVIPTIFAILEVLDWTDGRIAFPEASSLTLTLTAIFLPFSSVFVSMKMDEFSSRHGSLMRNMWDGPETKFGNGGTNKTWNSSSTHDHQGAGIELADRSGNKTTTVASRSEPAHRRDSTELDLEALGVRVDKSYSVRSGRQT